MFVGQVAREMREREAFQELDYRAVFGTMAKWATEIDDPARIPEVVSRAFHVAMNGRPGPVVIALPEDMLMERVSVGDALAADTIETWPGLTDMSHLQKMLWAAERPIMMLGGSRWSEAASAAVVRFAERFDMPVVTSFRRMQLFPCDASLLRRRSRHGRQSEAGRAHEGGRPPAARRRPLGEMPSARLHAARHPESEDEVRSTSIRTPDELGRVYRPDLAINAAPTAFAAALEGLQPPNEIRWRAETKEPRMTTTSPGPSSRPSSRARSISARSWCGCAGNCRPKASSPTGPATSRPGCTASIASRKFATLLGPTSGSMGYGLPAAVGAKRLYPERTVVCVAGDGDFLMNGQEFATAVQYDLPIIVLIMDNGMYGTIRAHQEREFPGRIIATSLRNPDFAAYARAFGGFGATWRRPSSSPTPSMPRRRRASPRSCT